MESVKCTTSPSCRLANWLVKKKETDLRSNNINRQVEIRRAVVSVGQLVCGGELELFTAIQVHAGVTGSTDVMQKSARVRVAQTQDSNAG